MSAPSAREGSRYRLRVLLVLPLGAPAAVGFPGGDGGCQSGGDARVAVLPVLGGGLFQVLENVFVEPGALQRLH